MPNRIVGIALAVALAGCGDSGPQLAGAPGVVVTKVALNQGVERVLAQNGTRVDSSVPLIAGRRGLLRVFYTATPEQVGQTVTVRLTIDGQDALESEAVLVAASSEGDLNSTINIEVDGDLIDANFDYQVELLQPDVEHNPQAVHPADGFEAHTVDIPKSTFRVHLVPFEYQFDGSDRLPDTSPAAVQVYRDRILQLYPSADVEVTVREPVPWTQEIAPFGQGWQAVFERVFQLRDSDGLGPDVYYYGIFNPRVTINQYCSQGCLLGVALLNDGQGAGDPELRMAIGVGFEETAADTCIHELGHAHGRQHAPCGNGLDPNSIDSQYPHAGGAIGVWGWDIVSGELVNPGQHTDIMGYCDSQWISDHNFTALANRGRNVNLPRWQGNDVDYQMVRVDGPSQLTKLGIVSDSRFNGPPSSPIQVTTPSGTKTVMGYSYSFDHLPGGWLFYPVQSAPVTQVAATLQGKQIRARLSH